MMGGKSRKGRGAQAAGEAADKENAKAAANEVGEATEAIPADDKSRQDGSAAKAPDSASSDQCGQNECREKGRAGSEECGGADESAGSEAGERAEERVVELEKQVAELGERLNSLTAERDTWQSKASAIYDQYLRSKGDFDSYRRRTERDFDDRLTREKGEYLRSMLSVLDNFDRFLQAAEAGGQGEAERNFEAFYRGVVMVHKQLLDVLVQQGVEAIPDAVGKQMDPSVHEAIVAVEGGGDHGVVLEELQKGYVYKGLVLRPTRVKVAK